MQHEMRLDKEIFEEVKNRDKKIEIRLLDKKRQLVKVNDQIQFSKRPDLTEKIIVKVIKITKYPDYNKLIINTPLTYFGKKLKSKEQLIKEGCTIYSKEEQDKYGFVVFDIELLTNKENSQNIFKLRSKLR